MAHVSDLIATDIDAYLEAHQHKSLLRFITCGSVDDGKSTLIGRLLYDFEDDLRGPARGAGGGLQEGRHPGRRNRLRPAGRRPRRRARTGHHHRCRLPVLLHRQAQVHRRRHARARAVHPQHGHRRLDRRPGGDPDRRPQGRADPDPAALVPGEPDRHPPHRAGGEQDGPGRLRPGGVRQDRRRLPRVRRRDRPDRHRGDPDLGPARRQYRLQERSHPMVRRPDADAAPRDRRDRRGAAAGRSVPPAGAVGQPPQPGLPRLRRRDRLRRGPAGRPGAHPALRPREPRGADRHQGRRPRSRRRRAVDHA